jgi:hypothetical protein
MDIEQQQNTFEFKGDIDILDKRPKQTPNKDVAGNN